MSLEAATQQSHEGVVARLEVTGRIEYLEPIHNFAEGLFGAVGIEGDEAYWLVLAVREAVINAMLHGSDEQPDTRIELEIVIEPERVRISVVDEGRGFDPDKVPDPVTSPNLMSQHGRGVFLIRRLMDEVRFDFPEEGGTRLRMTKVRGTAPSRDDEDQGGS